MKSSKVSCALAIAIMIAVCPMAVYGYYNFGEESVTCQDHRDCYKSVAPLEVHIAHRFGLVSFGRFGCECIDNACRVNVQINRIARTPKCIFCGDECNSLSVYRLLQEKLIKTTIMKGIDSLGTDTTGNTVRPHEGSSTTDAATTVVITDHPTETTPHIQEKASTHTEAPTEQPDATDAIKTEDPVTSNPIGDNDDTTTAIKEEEVVTEGENEFNEHEKRGLVTEGVSDSSTMSSIGYKPDVTTKSERTEAPSSTPEVTEITEPAVAMSSSTMVSVPVSASTHVPATDLTVGTTGQLGATTEQPDEVSTGNGMETDGTEATEEIAGAGTGHSVNTSPSAEGTDSAVEHTESSIDAIAEHTDTTDDVTAISEASTDEISGTEGPIVAEVSSSQSPPGTESATELPVGPASSDMPEKQDGDDHTPGTEEGSEGAVDNAHMTESPAEENPSGTETAVEVTGQEVTTDMPAVDSNTDGSVTDEPLHSEPAVPASTSATKGEEIVVDEDTESPHAATDMPSHSTDGIVNTGDAVEAETEDVSGTMSTEVPTDPQTTITTTVGVESGTKVPVELQPHTERPATAMPSSTLLSIITSTEGMLNKHTPPTGESAGEDTDGQVTEGTDLSHGESQITSSHIGGMTDMPIDGVTEDNLPTEGHGVNTFAPDTPSTETPTGAPSTTIKVVDGEDKKSHGTSPTGNPGGMNPSNGYGYLGPRGTKHVAPGGEPTDDGSAELPDDLDDGSGSGDIDADLSVDPFEEGSDPEVDGTSTDGIDDYGFEE